MDFFENLGLDIGYIVLGLSIFSVILLILLIIQFVQFGKLNKKYKKFMKGANGENLENQFIKRFSELDNLKIESIETRKKLEKTCDNLQIAYQKIGIVKYDAFKEMGGKLSFALAILNNNNNGYIINSMHSSREGCYTYIKEIIKGESFVVLAEEEKLALDEAKKSNDFMN